MNAQPSNQGRLVRVSDAARELAISDRHLRELIARGRVATIRIGRCVRVPRTEVDRLASAGA